MHRIGRSLRWAVIALILARVPAAAAQEAASAAALAVRDVTVVDVRAGSLRPGHTVLIAGNRIRSVGPSGSVDLADGARVIDARGKYVIPGLWDMHVHVLFEGMEGYLALLVANGVTGVREMGNSPMALGEIRGVRSAIQAGNRIGPRFVAAGVIVDGPQSPWQDGVAVVDSPERGRAVVDSLAAAGADFIKVYNYLPDDAYRVVLERARAHGLPVAGHVPMLLTPLEASNAGQRSFEHLVGLDQGCSSDERALIELSRLELDAIARADTARAEDLERQWKARVLATQDSARCRALLERLARNRTWQTPTLVNSRTKCMEPATLSAADHLRYVPGFMRDWWMDAWSEGDHDSPKTQARCVLQMKLVRKLHRADVPILAGSDAANPFVVWGFSLHEELRLLVEAGLSPLEALQAATLNPARYLEATDSLGTVEPGKLADLVLLEANPLEDIANTRKIAAVVLNGRYLDRGALDSLLASAERAARQTETTAPADRVRSAEDVSIARPGRGGRRGPDARNPRVTGAARDLRRDVGSAGARARLAGSRSRPDHPGPRVRRPGRGAGGRLLRADSRLPSAADEPLSAGGGAAPPPPAWKGGSCGGRTR